jgi:hypothetical protein
MVTTTEGDYAAIAGLESLIAYGDVLSVDVGGALAFQPGALAPGEYRGLLVIMAQYN